MLCSVASGFLFDLPANKHKCFTETLGKNTLVVGSYKAGDTSLTSQGLYVSVTSPSQKSEYSKSNEDSGKFAFTSSEDGNYKVCFTNKSPAQRRVDFDFKSGLHANDASRVAKKEHLKPLEAELVKLEGMADEILKSFEYLQEREAEHRNTNESTNTRVLWFTLLSIGLLVTLTIAQVLVLHRSLAKEKLIDSRPLFIS